jgi:hypothetical protein
VHLLDGTKIIVVDQGAAEEGVAVYQVSRAGIPLPKKVEPGPEHLYTVKVMRPPLAIGEVAKPGPIKVETLKMVCNEKGRFKQYWNTEKDGPKPVNPNAKKRVKAPPAPDAAPAKKSKKDAEEEEMANVIAAAVTAAMAAKKGKK